MYLPTAPPAEPAAPASPRNPRPAGGGAKAPAPPAPRLPAAPLPLFSRDGFVDPDAAPAPDAAYTDNPLPWLAGVAGIGLVLHGLLLLATAASLPAGGEDRVLLTLQWLAGGLLALPIGLGVFRLANRLAPALLAAGLVVLHPGVLSATLVPGGAFWALAAVAVAVCLLFGADRDPADGRRPLPGVGVCAAAGLVLGAGGLVALPAAALCLPLAGFRLLAGFGCPGAGRGPRDLAAAAVLVGAAAIPVAGFHAAEGASPAFSPPHAAAAGVVPRLIEGRWPELLDRFGLAPGLDLLGEVRAAFEGPPGDDQLAASPSAAAGQGLSGFDLAADRAWTAFNALLLMASLAAAALALHRRRRALGLLMLTAVPVAAAAADASGESLRLALLPLQLLLLGVFWLPARRFQAPSEAFRVPVGDAGFTIGQNTPRVL